MSRTSVREIQVVARGEEMRALVQEARAAGRSVGFVPTMGALHDGHLSLVDAALAECDHAAASIFVNPTQFGPQEDFSKYPRDLDRDLALLGGRGCRWAFVPSAEEMYPPGFDTYIDVGAIAAPWEGSLRPGHFRGVATVVHKLFQLVPADRAYFGQKDYQQTAVIRRMITDLNLPIELRVCPTVREADGLALSSRNAYLSADERRRALSLSRALAAAQELYAAGETDAEAIRTRMLEVISAVGGVELQYIAVMRDGDVEPVTRIDGSTIVAIAARVGATRLIDNVRLG